MGQIWHNYDRRYFRDNLYFLGDLFERPVQKIKLGHYLWLRAVYKELYSIYRQLHDVFGTEQWRADLYQIQMMKQLIQIRTRAGN